MWPDKVSSSAIKSFREGNSFPEVLDFKGEPISYWEWAHGFVCSSSNPASIALDLEMERRGRLNWGDPERSVDAKDLEAEFANKPVSIMIFKKDGPLGGFDFEFLDEHVDRAGKAHTIISATNYFELCYILASKFTPPGHYWGSGGSAFDAMSVKEAVDLLKSGLVSIVQIPYGLRPEHIINESGAEVVVRADDHVMYRVTDNLGISISFYSYKNEQSNYLSYLTTRPPAIRKKRTRKETRRSVTPLVRIRALMDQVRSWYNQGSPNSIGFILHASRSQQEYIQEILKILEWGMEHSYLRETSGRLRPYIADVIACVRLMKKQDDITTEYTNRLAKRFKITRAELKSARKRSLITIPVKEMTRFEVIVPDESEALQASPSGKQGLRVETLAEEGADEEVAHS